MTEEEKAELQNLVATAAKGIEDRLIASFGKVIEGINTKLELTSKAGSALETKAKTAFETLPAVIQQQVENQLGDLTKQFEERQKTGDGGSGGGGLGGGLNLRDLLGQSDKIISLINAWKQPSSEAQMMGQMNTIYRWHGLLSKLEKGGGSGEDVTKAIAETFASPKE